MLEKDGLEYRSEVYGLYRSSQAGAGRQTSLLDIEKQSHYLKRVIDVYFPQDRASSVVDLGCGSGAFVHLIRQAGYTNARGIDISREQIDEAIRLGIEGVTHGELLSELGNLSDDSVDVVITFDVIEHFTKNEVIYFAKQVLRVLTEQGIWIIHVPNGEGPFGATVFFSDFTHQVAYTRKSLTQMLRVCGFTEIDCYEDTVVVHGIISAIRWLLWSVFRSLARIVLAAETGDLRSRFVLTQNMLAVARKS